MAAIHQPNINIFVFILIKKVLSIIVVPRVTIEKRKLTCNQTFTQLYISSRMVK